MMGDKKNLTDRGTGKSVQYPTASLSVSISLSYTKTNKLITALYMVSDIMDIGEPMKDKLRSVGLDILSDIARLPIGGSVSGPKVQGRVKEVLALLEISQTMGMISEMNVSILKREFLELNHALDKMNQAQNRAESLEDFFAKDEPPVLEAAPRVRYKSIGHVTSTRLGVQKASTLMQALSDKKFQVSDSSEKFDLLRKQRREEIVSIIKEYVINYPSLGGATITDIKTKATGVLVNCGEKTLQRELVSMVTESVLLKKGTKRWSRYSLA